MTSARVIDEFSVLSLLITFLYSRSVTALVFVSQINYGDGRNAYNRALHLALHCIQCWAGAN